MITKYNTYIKEGVEYAFNDEINDYLNEILPENTNITFISDERNEVSIYMRDNGRTLITVWYKKLSLYYKFTQYFSDEAPIEFQNINDLKHKIKVFMYHEHYRDLETFVIKGKHKTLLKNIPVYNIKSFNEMVLNLLDYDDTYISQLKDIQQYLDMNILHKYKHYLDALNFDLI